MRLLDVIIIVAYFAILIYIGYLGVRRARTSEDYVLAGRGLSLLPYTACLSAVILGGASTIGTARLGYEYGISGVWLVSMIGVGIVILGLFISKRIYDMKVTTIAGMLEVRYNSYARLISAIVAAIYAMMIAVTQVIGVGTILHALIGWDMITSMLLGGGIVLFYTMLGGMWSVTMTDSVQFIIMTIGIFFVMLPMSMESTGGWSSLRSQLPESYFDITHIGIDRILQYFLLFGLGMVVSQDIWQRVLTARSRSVSIYGTVLAGAYSIAYGIAVSIIGMCGAIVLSGLDDPQNTFPVMARRILPNGLLGIVVAAVASALMSTASGALIASSTLITDDIVKRFFCPTIGDDRYLRIARSVTLTVGVVTIVLAAWIQDVLIALDVAYAVLSGCVFVPTVLGLYWRRATGSAALVSMVISAVAVVLGMVTKGMGSSYAIVYGMLSGLVSMVAFSILLRPSRSVTAAQ